MQTTLLGVAIAIILALVAALVAPLVIDWSQYRTAFEEEASRLTGLAVRVNGTIDARILLGTFQLGSREHVRFRSTHPTRDLAPLLAWAAGRGMELERLTVTRPTLEDIYLELTEEAAA